MGSVEVGDGAKQSVRELQIRTNGAHHRKEVVKTKGDGAKRTGTVLLLALSRSLLLSLSHGPSLVASRVLHLSLSRCICLALPLSLVASPSLSLSLSDARRS